MKDFLVTWEIELQAESAEEAAMQAWEILRMPDSTANVFVVHGDSDREPEKVDIQECLEHAESE